MDIKLVILDCDGILVDSEPLGKQAFAELLTAHGYPISREEALNRFKGIKLADCFIMVEEEGGTTLPKDFRSRLQIRTDQLLRRHLKPIPGVVDLLESLLVDFCVASNAPKSEIQTSLNITDLDTYFSSNLYSSYDIGFWKPDPNLFLHIAEVYKLVPRECLVIEDSNAGIRAGQAAGMEVVGFGPEDNRVGLPPSVNYFQHMSEVQQFLVQRGLARSIK